MSQVEISCRNLIDVSWQSAASCPYHIKHSVDLWKVKVVDNPLLINSFISVMAPHEIDRGNRFYQLKDKNRHIFTRGALRHILGNYLNKPPGAIEFDVSKTHKPFIKNTTTPLYFNVSHSGDWILFGVSDTELGADVEFIKPAFNYQEIIHHNFSLKESQYITDSQSLDRFFKLWTRKEALLKATGQGLNNDLSKFSCLDGTNVTESSLLESAQNWQISSFRLGSQYWGSVCNNPSTNQFNFWSFEL